MFFLALFPPAFDLITAPLVIDQHLPVASSQLWQSEQSLLHPHQKCMRHVDLGMSRSFDDGFVESKPIRSSQLQDCLEDWGVFANDISHVAIQSVFNFSDVPLRSEHYERGLT